MTPPEHFVLALSASNAIYSLLHLRKRIPIPYLVGSLAAGLTGMAPDIDSFFGYYGSLNPWIGHRGMTHSFVGIAILAAVISFSALHIWPLFRFITSTWRWIYSKVLDHHTVSFSGFRYWHDILVPFRFSLYYMLFFLCYIGGLTHILADLTTPKSNWTGLPLFWPMKTNGQYTRYGDWNFIGWYDYKIFWICAGACIAALGIIFIIKIIRFFDFYRAARILGVILFAFHIGLFYKITDHIRHSRYTGERNWHISQQQMLRRDFPPEIVNITTKFGRIVAALYIGVRNRY